MRKLITTTFVTLDGIMQAPGGQEEDASGNFEFGGWQAPLGTPELGDFLGELMGREFDLLLGRKTYDIFASYWPNEGQSEEMVAVPFNKAVKYVASRSKIDLPWDNSQLIEGDLIEGIKAIKNGDGPELHVWGSSDLIQDMLAGGVIDEMNVITCPIVLGKGKRLFKEGATPTTFNVTNTTVGKNGTVISVCEPTPGVETGTVGA